MRCLTIRIHVSLPFAEGCTLLMKTQRTRGRATSLSRQRTCFSYDVGSVSCVLPVLHHRLVFALLCAVTQILALPVPLLGLFHQPPPPYSFGEADNADQIIVNKQTIQSLQCLHYARVINHSFIGSSMLLHLCNHPEH